MITMPARQAQLPIMLAFLHKIAAGHLDGRLDRFGAARREVDSGTAPEMLGGQIYQLLRQVQPCLGDELRSVRIGNLRELLTDGVINLLDAMPEITDDRSAATVKVFLAGHILDPDTLG